MGAAPRLAEIIARRPHVPDALLEPAFFGDGGGRGELAAALEQSLARGAKLRGRARPRAHLRAEQRFLIAVGLLTGTLAPAEAGKAFSDLADAIVGALLERARRNSRSGTDA